MKTGRTNSTSKGKEEATLKKLERKETQFGRKEDHGCPWSGVSPGCRGRARNRLSDWRALTGKMNLHNIQLESERDQIS